MEIDHIYGYTYGVFTESGQCVFEGTDVECEEYVNNHDVNPGEPE